MWNPPTAEELKQIPDFYTTEDVPLREKIIYMHFFIGGCDWYIAEVDHQNLDTMFGFAILNNDLQMAEWGYISLRELKEISVSPGIEIDQDLYWKVRPAKKVERICQASGWLGV